MAAGDTNSVTNTAATMSTTTIKKPKGLRDYTARKASVDFGPILMSTRNSSTGDRGRGLRSSTGSRAISTTSQQEGQGRGSLNGSINMLDAIFAAGNNGEVKSDDDDGGNNWWESPQGNDEKAEQAPAAAHRTSGRAPRRHLRRRSISDSNLNKWLTGNIADNNENNTSGGRAGRIPQSRRSGGSSGVGGRPPINFTVRKDIVKDHHNDIILDGEPGSDSSSRLSYDHHHAAAEATASNSHLRRTVTVDVASNSTPNTTTAAATNNFAAIRRNVTTSNVPQRKPIAGSFVAPPRYWAPKSVAAPAGGEKKKESQIQWHRNNLNDQILNHHKNHHHSNKGKRHSDPMSIPSANAFVTGSRIRRLGTKTKIGGGTAAATTATGTK